MTRFLLQRLSQAVIMLLLMSILFFLLIHLLPGGPEAVLFNPRVTGAVRTTLRHKYGLDQPLITQYIAWLGSAIRGDFGNSFNSGQPVISEIAARVPATIELFSATFFFALVLAILLGILSAVHRHSLIDQITTVLAYFSISMPIFWLALMLQIAFGVQLRVLPTYGRFSLNAVELTAFQRIGDHVRHLVLPAMVLSLSYIGIWSRYLRSSILDVLNQDYIRTARAKGLRPYGVLFHHALRNALMPFITEVAIAFGSIFGGAVITETVFAWPGLGRLFYDSLTKRDYPILLTMLLLSTTAVIFGNVFADIAYASIDPRVRYSGIDGDSQNHS